MSFAAVFIATATTSSLASVKVFEMGDGGVSFCFTPTGAVALALDAAK